MKAILVIDMPNECMECPLRFKDGDTDDWFRFRCHISEDQINKGERLENCPLRPIPKKIEAPEIYELWNTDNNEYIKGWNDCIDEILG